MTRKQVTPDGSQSSAETQPVAALVSTPDQGHPLADAQAGAALVSTDSHPSQAHAGKAQTVAAGVSTNGSQISPEAHTKGAAITDTSNGQSPREAHPLSAVAFSGDEDDEDQQPREIQSISVSRRPVTPLNAAVSMFYGAQHQRKRLMNQFRCLLRDSTPRDEWADTDFKDESLADAKILPYLDDHQHAMLDIIKATEKAAIKYCGLAVKRHRLWPFLEAIKGIDVVLAARLLHHIADTEYYPNIGKFWSYCGYAGPMQTQRATRTERSKANPGMGGGYNTKARTTLHVIAGNLLKANNPTYRPAYDNAKAWYQTRPGCGRKITPTAKGKPCPTPESGEPCTKAHIHRKAMVRMMKVFLADLWVYGRTHEQPAR